jgi:hypothetical protein
MTKLMSSTNERMSWYCIMPDLDIVNISFLLLHVAATVQAAFVALLNA